MSKKVEKGSAKNVVERAVDEVGGIIQAAAIMRVSQQSVYAWIRKGEISLARPAVLLARASGLKLEDLIGLKE
jgi:hypothetical protein